MSETKLHNIQNHRQSHNFIYLISYSGLNSSKHCPKSISFYFPHESNFDFLLSFPIVSTVTHF
jgi:hypothetical protein